MEAREEGRHVLARVFLKKHRQEPYEGLLRKNADADPLQAQRETSLKGSGPKACRTDVRKISSWQWAAATWAPGTHMLARSTPALGTRDPPSMPCLSLKP